MGYVSVGGYYGGGMNAGMETVSSASSFDWILFAVIAGSIVLGIIVGIILGKKAMKKRDVL